GMSRKFHALLKLTRPPNAILMYIAVIAGIVLSDSKSFQPEKLALALITAYGLCGSSMGFNDYFDREVDRVNAPWRPIPSGVVSAYEAAAFSAALGVLGLASSALTSTQCLTVASIAYAASLAYNAWLKKSGLPGNMIVSGVVAAPFIYGSILSDGYISTRLATFILPVFLSNLGREVIKGISDVEGDSLRGVKSIARIMGPRFAARLGASLYMAAVAVSPLPYMLGLVSWIYIPIVAVADTGFTYSAYSILRDYSGENALKVKSMTLIWMLLGLIAFIAGSV
ncbi:MAG: UbiA family prenyltransferase, partial [Thaumarchaeota archaeon]|nr:UbiA family prenyltransferase [Candidatus Wolframiiraptor allenii]